MKKLTVGAIPIAVLVKPTLLEFISEVKLNYNRVGNSVVSINDTFIVEFRTDKAVFIDNKEDKKKKPVSYIKIFNKETGAVVREYGFTCLWDEEKKGSMINHLNKNKTNLELR